MFYNDMKISGLTPPVLFDLADHIRTFAEQIERTANHNEQRLSERRNAGGRKRTLRAASQHFSSLIENGMDTKKALEEASVKYCIEKDAIMVMVTLFKTKQIRIEKTNRDRSIMKMWRAGHPVPLVAQRNNVTRRTVQRVVKEFKQI